MRVSITLPSLFPDHLNKTISLIQARTRSVDYEIIVVSPFEVTGPRVVWVREDQPRGNVPAQRAAFAHATGDFVLAFTDDAELAPGWDAQCLQNFASRERGQELFCLGLNLRTRTVGTAFGIYYPFFPFARRSCFAKIGYFCEPYKAHFADVDLGFRIWDAGGRCEFSEKPLVTLHNPIGREASHKNKTLTEDMASFVARWAPKYGAGWDTSQMTGFNIEIGPMEGLVFARENTIRFNDPKFKELFDNYISNSRQCRVMLTFPD